MTKGKLIISLDFEIYWGVRDAIKLQNYKENLIGVHKVVPRLLKIFKDYNINATFATVGFLFFKDKNELLAGFPERKPQYANENLSPYGKHLNSVGKNEEEDPFHFGRSLIEQIKKANQEVGCHTFSHYYCLEKGQTPEDFQEDLVYAKKIAEKNGIQMESFVFPRNQFNEAYLSICNEQGFTSFRGNEKSTLFSSKTMGIKTFLRRPFRLADAYINLSGHNCYSDEEMQKTHPLNIPSSRFLRPFSKRLAFLDYLKLKRITNDMTYAAKNSLTYHLWWHPHNFGANISENFAFLEQVLLHFQNLQKTYNFESMSMQQLANTLNADRAYEKTLLETKV